MSVVMFACFTGVLGAKPAVHQLNEVESPAGPDLRPANPLTLV